MTEIEPEEEWKPSPGVTIYFKADEPDDLEKAYELGYRLEEEVEESQAGEWVGSGFAFDTRERDVQFDGEPAKLLEVIRKVLLELEDTLPVGSYLTMYDGQTDKGSTMRLEDLLRD